MQSLPVFILKAVKLQTKSLILMQNSETSCVSVLHQTAAPTDRQRMAHISCLHFLLESQIRVTHQWPHAAKKGNEFSASGVSPIILHLRVVSTGSRTELGEKTVGGCLLEGLPHSIDLTPLCQFSLSPSPLLPLISSPEY